MRAENYLMQYILRNNISIKKIETDTGINMEDRICEGKDLMTDEFLGLCVYLGITPEEVSDQIL